VIPLPFGRRFGYHDRVMIGNSARTPIKPKVKAAIERILRANLSRYGFVGATIEPREDHDGDPAIFVDAQYQLSDEPVDSRVTLATLSMLRDRLINLGEDRFPYLRHHFAEGQQVLGDIGRRSPRRRA
jgi:hypothetical protein